MKQVDRLARKLPAQSQIDREIVLHTPVVSGIRCDVVFLEIEFGSAVRQT